MTFTRKSSGPAKNRRVPLLIWAGWLLASAVLHVGPPALRERLTTNLQDVTGLSLNWLTSRTHHSETQESSPATQHAALEQTLLAEICRLNFENQALRAANELPSIPAPALVIAKLISTRVIGQSSNADAGLSKWLAAQGSRQGLTGTELVLTGPGLLAEHGSLLGLRPDQLACAGKSLFGRVSQVGRWTSLIQPVTDPSFRISSRIVRRSPQGAVQGATGILRGTGRGCVLELVDATEAVAIGDLVYTHANASPAGVALFCGKVVHAEIGPSDEHWHIEVQPAHSSAELPDRLDILSGELFDLTSPPGS